MESAETIPAGICSASASATAVFPEAVGPKIARTRLFTQSRACELQILVREAARAQEALHAPVATFELLEHVDHRLRRCRGDPADAFLLRLRPGLGQPDLVPRLQALLAERVVRRDLFDSDAREAEQQCRHETSA